MELFFRSELTVLQVAALVLTPLLAVAAGSAISGVLIRMLAALLGLRGVTFPSAFRAALVGNCALAAFGASFFLAFKVTGPFFDPRSTMPAPAWRFDFWGHLLSFLLAALLYLGALVWTHNLIFSHFLHLGEEGAGRKTSLLSVLYLAASGFLSTIGLALCWIFFRT